MTDLPVELRTLIGLAIARAFERTYVEHGISFDPDTCYEAADEVLALLVSALTGVEHEARRHPSIIGPAEIRRVVGWR